MLVSDVINFSKTGELKQLRLSYVDDDDCDQFDNEATLLGFINLGLIELYKRFAFKKVTQQLANTIDGATYNMGDDYLYIYYACGIVGGDAEETVTMPLNNEFANMSLFENEPYVLTVVRHPDYCEDVNEIDVTYIATPALLTDVDDVVPLKYQYIEPLLQFMAYRAHSSLTASPEEDNQTYYQRFETSVKRLKRDGTETPDNQSNYKLPVRGWV
jgi:hypothetical protein